MVDLESRELDYYKRRAEYWHKWFCRACFALGHSWAIIIGSVIYLLLSRK